MQKARQLAKVRAWDAEREQKCVSLKPVTFGCCWTNGSNKLAESVLNKLLEFQVTLFVENKILPADHRHELGRARNFLLVEKLPASMSVLSYNILIGKVILT